MKFTEFNFHPLVLKGVEKNGFVECTEIQQSAMPLILEGKDLAGLAQTGTGKTAAFLLPLMDRVLRAKNPVGDGFDERAFKDFKGPNFVLVLVPTRELAEQVYENFKNLGSETGLKSVAIYGGTSYDPQTRAVQEGVDFIIATPGRLIDLFKEHIVDLGQARAVVFDEADRMFDMGFKDDMKFILRRIPRDRHLLVFSATLNFEVLEVSYEFGSHPVEINVSRDQAKADNVKDEIFHVGNEDKAKYLLGLFKKNQPKQAIVFSNFRFNVERVAEFLSQNGFPAMGISSLLTQSQRLRVMNLFRAENDKNILVATDLAARGLDIKGVDLVINYELPDDPENYVHRIGRTGRAGATGKAYSLVSDKDVESLGRIENYLGHKVDIGWIEDTDLTDDFKPFPRDREKRPFKPKGDRPGGSHRSGGRPQHGGAGGSGPNGRRPDQPRSDRPQHSSRPNPNGQGPRPQHNNRPRPERPDQRNDRRPEHHSRPRPNTQHGGKHQGPGRPEKRKHGQPYRHRPTQNNAPVKPQGGIKEKISGFLKKLFGNEKPKGDQNSKAK